MSSAVSLERIENSLVIRFVRPEIRNPLSVEVVEYITSIVEELDPSVGRVIFTGTSEVFAAGADLREIDKVSVEEAKEFALRGQRLMNSVNALPDTVAAINGFCFGGALDLALSCRRRIAVATAEFCHPGVGLGIITGWGGTQRLPRLVGETAALEMFMTARRVSAEDALRIGLIDEVTNDPVMAAVVQDQYV
ncbi:MAG: enoyl-CoA hydratase/isomerase family protein [Acidobacteria bacterium]|nr:enoyl-CoA hydratase/isomerase family protein [Acidobacteriota bacterium]MBP7475527.1 enoyl-CoA hydratase/isomerase family protein [Pyrinomonadaceae bacterium]MBP9110137.1 enoyl-CoA hydratase/isomerase family protein [Pyrinomonadaceae bacterium]